MLDTGIHFSIIRNVDYFYTSKFNWMPVSGHWNNKKRAGPSLYIRYRLSYDRDKRDRLRSRRECSKKCVKSKKSNKLI
uniref:hypothetical protein n=1 Tax=Wolbachia pipientis TaxID=955 RepID=UPI0038B63480